MGEEISPMEGAYDQMVVAVGLSCHGCLYWLPRLSMTQPMLHDQGVGVRIGQT
jgi:hypothetical protein